LRERVGDDRLIVRAIAGQVFVSTASGNLARETAATPEDRERRFAEFLNEFHEQLGLTGSNGAVQFRAAAAEEPLGIGASGLYTLFLEPVYSSSAVVDRPQSAAYDAGTGELRSVLAWSVDFVTLPQPPVVNASDQERARVAVLRHLQRIEDGSGRIAVRDTPVISAQHGRAGYLVEYRSRDEVGAGLWVRALFDPRDGAVLILQQEERDDFPMPARTGP
jgi:hypothetical protein